MDRLLHALKQISEKHGELPFAPPCVPTAEPAPSTSTALVVVEPSRPAAEPEESAAPVPPPIPSHLVDWVEPARLPLLSAPAEYAPVEYAPLDHEPVEYVLVEQLPVDEVPSDQVPVDSLPVEPTEVEHASIEPTPVDELPVEQAAVTEPVEEPAGEREPTVELEPTLSEIPAPVARGVERRFYTPLAVSEEIAAVRDHILAQLHAKPSRVIGLVHADRAGEESAVVAELARAFVGFAAGEVLAIDARAQGPGWGAKLGCQHSAGAEALLLGQKTLEQVVHPTTWAGLHAVPAGTHRHDIEAARSAEIEHQLACCREAYNTVLIDLGCVDAMHVVPIARRCDATFLVVRLGETRRQHARTALARLQYAGVNALDCILTTAPTLSGAA